MTLGGIYLVTPDSMTSNFFEVTEKAIVSGVSILQYRNKSSGFQDKLEVAQKLSSLAYRYNRVFIIDDDVDLAIAVNADGLHIGKDDIPLPDARKRLPDKIIGYSTYGSREIAVEAQSLGADYVSFGPFFATNSKKDAGLYDIKVLEEIKKYVHVPIFAIGGINPENAAMLRPFNLDGICVISWVYSSADPGRAVKELMGAFYGMDYIN
ncbi:MAG: thiamine phosphate synthase [Candidatus Thermoplasmatota archaeon]|jgi:thiamine-phosphate pyrophosphorylase|nr:thiamine phosphate synthase [Candidatus Thermoplasmatota archaeon]